MSYSGPASRGCHWRPSFVAGAPGQRCRKAVSRRWRSPGNRRYHPEPLASDSHRMVGVITDVPAFAERVPVRFMVSHTGGQ